MQTNIQDDKGTLRWCIGSKVHVVYTHEEMNLDERSYTSLCDKEITGYLSAIVNNRNFDSFDCPECAKLAKLMINL